MRRVAGCLCAVVVFLALVLPLFPLTVQGAGAVPEVEAGAYVVMDAKTGQVLLAKDENQLAYPASITKILTNAMLLDAYAADPDALSSPVTVSESAVNALIYNAASVWLKAGEVVSLQDLLYTSQVRSANDSANMLAEFASGSIENFAAAMTAQTRQLGLPLSNFTNPSGLPDANHMTTAYEMAEITRWALTVPGFRELFAAVSYTMPATNMQDSPRQLTTTNEMIKNGGFWNIPEVTGGKTGYTTDAQYTMVTTAARGDVELICVVLRCPTNEIKYNSTAALLEYCFDNFVAVQLPAQNLRATQVPVYGGGGDSLGDITVCGGADISFLLHKSLSLADVDVQYDIPGRYVIGSPFVPVARLYLPAGSAYQQALLLDTPLSWKGLDEILNAHTKGVESEQASHASVYAWVITGTFAVLLFMFSARALYVRHRRNKRRNARLAAIKAQMPIRVADRPPPPVVRKPGAKQFAVYRPAPSKAAGRPSSVAFQPVRSTPPAYAQKRAGRKI